MLPIFLLWPHPTHILSVCLVCFVGWWMLFVEDLCVIYQQTTRRVGVCGGFEIEEVLVNELSGANRHWHQQGAWMFWL